MNSNDNYLNEGFKECAGRSCKNTAKVPLKIRYINKTGFFCESCADYLLRAELAIGEQIDKRS